MDHVSPHVTGGNKMNKIEVKTTEYAIIGVGNR